MTPDQWQRVKHIAAEALDLPAADRVARIEQMSEGDTELRDEALNLLAECENCDPSFLSRNPWNVRAVLGELPRAKTALKAGDAIAGRFEIIRFLDSGGMGEVYEAWDRELQERVALKTIRPEIAREAGAIEAFKGEVKHARRVAHTNVCRVYDLLCDEESNSQRTFFLTMEFVDGVTLKKRLEDGPLDRKTALDIAGQLARGLEAAHRLGVVHKDFKSSNVMLVREGDQLEDRRLRAVIMDFGLAVNVKYGPVETGGAAGTPAYMAPEQRAGAETGPAADIYALGVVLYEMRTGRLPSRDEYGALLPGWERLDPRWTRTVERCLRVRPPRRFATAAQVLLSLDKQFETPARRWMWAATVIIMGLAAAGVAWVAASGGSRLRNLVQLTSGEDLSESPSLSRDGSIVVYASDRGNAGNLDIWAQRLPSEPPVRITTDPAEDTDPNVSPDGRLVVFHSERQGGGAYIAGIDGKGEHLLAAGGRNPAFSPDGTRIVFWVGDSDTDLPSAHLYVAPTSGGTPIPIAADFKDARDPMWSSDGRHILFTGCRDSSLPAQACSEWWATDLEGHVYNTGGLSAIRAADVSPTGTPGVWNNGTVLFSGMRGTARGLFEIRIPNDSLRVSGPPRALTSGEDKEYSPTLAASGKIAFGRATFALHVWRIDDARASTPSATKVTDDAEADYTAYISHTGRWLVFGRLEPRGSSIWLKDMSQGKEARLIASAPLVIWPLVDETGEQVLYEVRDRENPSIVLLQRGQQPRTLCHGCSSPEAWYEPGKTFFYTSGLLSEIHLMDLASGSEQTVLHSAQVSVGDADWNPLSRSLAFTAAASDGVHKQMFVTHLDERLHATPWVPVTNESEWTARPRWSGDGKMLYYLSTRDGFQCIWARPFDVSAGRPSGEPFAVLHYHDQRFSPSRVITRAFNLSAAGNSIYLNPAEETETIWLASLLPDSWLRH